MKILITGGSGFIGTNLTLTLKEKGVQFLNLDRVPPKIKDLEEFWVKCDILDFEKLKAEFNSFLPHQVIHLAAETDTDPVKSLKDYLVNTDGSKNIVDLVVSVGSVERFVLTSTQFVNQSALGPAHDEDYAPHTIYGESKIISEKYLRNTEPSACWTIVRPTNIWGPWHLRYPFEFWKILAEGKYFHPGRKKVIRSYGYVGNVVDQILKILESPKELVHKKVYYVGDRPIDLYDWVNGFSIGQTGRRVRVMPRFLVYFLAVLGDILQILNIKFPITISRYKSMTTDNPANMKKTFDELGAAKYSLPEGIQETISWMKINHPELVKTSFEPSPKKNSSL